jgi:hypothetical protein
VSPVDVVSNNFRKQHLAACLGCLLQSGRFFYHEVADKVVLSLGFRKWCALGVAAARKDDDEGKARLTNYYCANVSLNKKSAPKLRLTLRAYG